ncbi:cytochrome P450 4C1-like [Daktulosphaira vitifoliae]|uniref:cytochrome P450 4C1-like n=1 Tax=Daktulosphaira vitifoliae TaxID=58002 RepID=UPI0021A9C4C0|nr:cytochrome P450 4C1-like [Daktulosphaira vitifoliae]XP_050545280.1 cytochrome P450 4C1-like [Daktulosphaira vitifoliae]XP_050545281.1 cytochrome P450 4C1-like [Daktulosphaira vitifoliae]XP_050545282.1 cytochrome P450 4C1-like [Daktulosphaira vitifoliae]
MNVTFYTSPAYSNTLGEFWQTKVELVGYIIVIFLVIIWCRIKWNRRFIDRFAAKIPGPPSYPLIGSGLEFIGRSQDIMEKFIKLNEQYGPEPFKIWLGSSLVLNVTKPEYIQIILNNSNILDRGKLSDFLSCVLGEGLLTASVPTWKMHRRIISPFFNSSHINILMPIFNEKCTKFIRNLKKELRNPESFNIWDYVVSLSFDTICETALGYRRGTQDNDKSEYLDSMTKITEQVNARFTKPWLYPDIIFNIYGKITGLNQMYENLIKFTDKIIKEKKTQYAQKKKPDHSSLNLTRNGKKQRKVFLDALLELNDEGANFSKKYLRDEVLTIMSTGSESISLTTCFCILMLAIHQDIQEKVYDEIYRIMGGGDRIVTIEDTVKFVYLEQCIKETLRLYPVGPVILRHLHDDIKLSNYTIPKDTTIFIPILVTHRLAELYPNPLEYNPDNFDPEKVVNRHKYSFIPFSDGPRNCIGQKYVMLLMKVLLSTFLRNYSVHTKCKMSDIKLKLELAIKNVHGYQVTIRPRDRTPT